jgi:UDP-N-acetylglucosamine--dolichyl-phosphate N-acetylglucosaminephosphotransferase
MISPLIIIALLAAFLITIALTPQWIKRAKKAGISGKDVNKLFKEEVAEMGGVIVVFAFVCALFIYIGIQTFVFNDVTHTAIINATIIAVLIAAIIGIVDDILGWKIGLRQSHKVILTIIIAIPVMVVNAGHSTITLPFLGQTNIGLFFPLLLVPIAIVGASNAFNMIGGYNGLETGMGIVVLTTLAFLARLSGEPFAGVIAIAMVCALIGFLLYNKFPASVFPGDTLTYSVGALIAIVAILANVEKFALVVFIPYIIEFILKARGKFKKESFGKIIGDGSIVKPYEKYYGLEHIAIDLVRKVKKKCYEVDVVLTVIGFQVIFAVLAVVIYLI